MSNTISTEAFTKIIGLVRDEGAHIISEIRTAVLGDIYFCYAIDKPGVIQVTARLGADFRTAEIDTNRNVTGETYAVKAVKNFVLRYCLK